MCGIAGIFQYGKENTSNLSKVIDKIIHRGPDAKGLWKDKNISLASVRLNVVDLDKRSNQPFISKNKKFVIVFNGEIYNYLNLKKKYNIKTNTNSDTEIIVELFNKIGPKVFSLLEGMFAISIYDIANRKLYLARDSFGIKPLYFYLKKKKLIFCSEIKGILEIEKNISINNKTIIDFIKWGGLDHSTETWFANIENIEPGSYFLIDRNFNLKKFKYYKLQDNLFKNNFHKKDIPYIFKDLLKKSVKSQSQTARSIGTNLSGGVDSSIVTSFLQEINPKINSYTFGYKEKKYDERPFARSVSNKLGINNFTSITDPKDVNDNFISTLIMQDEPFTSFRQISHHKLYSDFKKSGSTVIMESSGGDEIGAGYTGFLWPFFMDQINEIGFEKAENNFFKILKSLKFQGDEIDKFINAGMYNQKFYGSSTSDGQKIIDDNCISNSYAKKYDRGAPQYEKFFENNLLNSQYIELFHTKLPRGLRYVDRASSSSGREARVPLLNKEIVEFCFSIPNESKIHNGELRWFMKKSLDYLNRKNINLSNKRSIADPQRIWIKKNFKKLFLSLFKSKRFKVRGIFNQKEVLKSYNNFLKNDNAHSLGIFQIFITEIWLRIFFDNKPDYFYGEKLDNFIYDTND
jgi:asparagine synthase (glutamine-hydrolysing)